MKHYPITPLQPIPKTALYRQLLKAGWTRAGARFLAARADDPRIRRQMRRILNWKAGKTRDDQ